MDGPGNLTVTPGVVSSQVVKNTLSRSCHLNTISEVMHSSEGQGILDQQLTLLLICIHGVKGGYY